MPFVPDMSDRLVQSGFPAALAEELQTLIQGTVSGGGNFDATDSGTNWASAPAALAIQAVLTVGTTTTVLLEVMDKAATVTTAATITADTISQVLNITVALVGAAQYRLRRSTGTGTVNLLVQR
jgi:hypothetical protein